MNTSRLQEICSEVRKASEETADFIRSQVGLVASGDIEAKAKNSLVSYVDKQAESMLVERLTPLIPNPGFITEEDTVINSRAEYTWIIDPLDGTTNFLQGIPVFSVSVALSYNGEVVVGCVVDIMQNDSYYAWKGGGAWLNDKRIHVSDTPDISESVLATGFPYYSPDKLNILSQLFHDILLSCRAIRRLGSAALDMTYVACGKFDGFYETELNAWDVAAGTLLVREAGGVVTDFDGETDFVRKRMIIATNGNVHGAISEILTKHTLV